ncbi:hypothetical protein DYB30_011593, partial [Aphanomyces astaci]
TTGHWFGKKWDDQDPVVENLLVTLEDFFKDLKAWISSSFFYAKVVRQALDRVVWPGLMDDASVKRSKLLKDLMVATKRLVPALSSSSQGTMSQGGKATTTKQTKPKKATFFKKPKGKADDKAQPITTTTDAAAAGDFEAVERGAKAAKTLKELATVVQADLDDKQGRGWHVVAGKDFAVDIRYATVMESDMLAPFESEVLSVCQRLAVTPDDSDVLCSTLKNWLTQQYGHTWHVVVSTGSRDLVGAVHANPGTLLDVVFAKALSSQTNKNPQHQQHVRFLVYQHGGFEASLDLITLLHRVCLVLAAMAGALFLFYRLSY